MPQKKRKCGFSAAGHSIGSVYVRRSPKTGAYSYFKAAPVFVRVKASEVPLSDRKGMRNVKRKKQVAKNRMKRKADGTLRVAKRRYKK